jgi:phenylpropionate dioxygenase-like ring-hydroxylating dioxygenase large terminal subunit
MNDHSPPVKQVPVNWDRRGLPAWAYHSQAVFDLERTHVFLNHWQVACHVNDVANPGDWRSFDLLGERAFVVRGQDGTVRAFHNLCRHRGARVVDGAGGSCKGALVCPFHGWVYNLDGTLRGAARPETFGEMDREKFGLKPVEMEIWHGFVFIRFLPGPQPSVVECLQPYDADFKDFRAAGVVSAGDHGYWGQTPVNWKSVCDVDNEGYHVALAHPSLQELYGRSYDDIFHENGLLQSNAVFGDRPGRRWSVRNYVKLSPVQDWLPKRLQRAWNYYGLFPNTVFIFTPESVQYYQEIPISLGETWMSFAGYRQPGEDRQTCVARYLGARIDRDTSAEDQQLTIWSNESMKSLAFDDFHLSDLEYGVKWHHDRIRALLPVTTLEKGPKEDEIAQINAEMLVKGRISDSII